jgi:hypothetical protein
VYKVTARAVLRFEEKVFANMYFIEKLGTKKRAGHATFGRFSGCFGDFEPLRARTHENYSPWQGQAAAVLTFR